MSTESTAHLRNNSSVLSRSVDSDDVTHGHAEEVGASSMVTLHVGVDVDLVVPDIDQFPVIDDVISRADVFHVKLDR